MRAIHLVAAALMLVSLAIVLRAEDKPADVDWDKARQLYQREQKGESLSAEEKAYLDHAKEIRRQMNQRGGKPATGPAVAPPRASTGLVPLTQMKGDQKYKGRDGGLYGGGKNDPPDKLLNAARDAAAQIRPLGPDGTAAEDGRIVLMSLGMSNTTMEFARFKQMADADAGKSPKVLIVDAAQGGQDAAKWDTTAEQSPWSVADQKLKSAGATPQQVQAIWIKQALAGPAKLGEFPAHSEVLQRHVESIIRIAARRYPNLKLVYLSSRIYAGYATTPLNPEPYAYESAFAMRGVIEDEMTGELHDPIVLWGPYLWTDGTQGRSTDNLLWTREDVAGDGTHPSESGRRKVAELLLNFFKTDATSRVWFCVKKELQ